MKLGAKELRVTKPTPEELAQLRKRPLWIILDNVLDTYNIGSLYRLADAVGAQELILCGGSESPPSSRIHRAAVGTEEWVQWRSFPTAAAAISALRSEVAGIRIVAVEQDRRAVSLTKLEKELPVAVIVGHETTGITREALELADVIVEIPMWGVNKSLNVHVSASVVVYHLLV